MIRPAIGDPVVLERLDPSIAARRPIDVAGAFRDLPGLALLESARPGRRARWSYLAADPIEVSAAPPLVRSVAGRAEVVRDVDPFRAARLMLRRLAVDEPGANSADGPPFSGGLIGYLGYDIGLLLEPRSTSIADDLDVPAFRLALHPWVVAWDRATGTAWLAGRVVDGDPASLDRSLVDVRRRLAALPASVGPQPADAQQNGAQPVGDELGDEPVFESNLDRAAFEDRVRSIIAAIAAGEIYQANLTRRLETAFRADPWPVYRRLRTGDPALLAAFLDLGPGRGGERRAIVSASPEPFLAVDRDGRIAADPIKGTRPRGRDRDADRALARELLESAKDRAENTMIVDVLRNDVGRVAVPGSVRVPRLCRLERTATVQHLVSTVTGRLAPDRDVFDLLAAAFPGGSITGAPKLRAMEILERLETVRRGPYTGALGWFGADGAMATSIVIRTLVADGRRLVLNVGGGITGRSDPSAEWDETRAKAAGPLGAIGGREAAE